MANVVAPFGLAPLNGRTLEGGYMQTVFYPATLADAHYIGDVEARAAGGNLTRTFTPGTTNVQGVCLQPKTANVATPTTAGLPICQQETMVYKIQDDGSAVLGVAIKGQNANLVITGSTRRGPTVSGDLINASAADTSSTKDLHILDAWGDPNNDATLASAIWVVTFNKHRLATGIAGV